MVSQAADRYERFTETNAEILRIADVIITLQSAQAGAGQAGGTQELAEMAKRHQKPVYALRVEVDDDEVLSLRGEWFSSPESFKAPSLPKALAQTALPKEGFGNAVKSVASQTASGLQKKFTRYAWIIIWTHVSATALAAAALALSYIKAGGGVLSDAYYGIPILLAIELILLSSGWYTHQLLTKERISESWATARLIAEVARSTLSFGPKDRPDNDTQPFPGQHTPLKYLFNLSLPSDFIPLADTLNVLHLHTTRSQKNQHWREQREHYIFWRLKHKTNGQIPYYEKEAKKAEHEHHIAHRLFNCSTIAAVFFTALKLSSFIAGCKHYDINAAASLLAILLPVAAVAFLSLAASLDRHARASHYREMVTFLNKQHERLTIADTKPEFLRLQGETEARLLGETVNWYYRRRYINPA